MVFRRQRTRDVSTRLGAACGSLTLLCTQVVSASEPTDNSLHLGTSTAAVEEPSAATSVATPQLRVPDSIAMEASSSTYIPLFQRALLPGPGGAVASPSTSLPVYEYLMLRVIDADTPWAKNSVDTELSLWGAGSVNGNNFDSRGGERQIDGDVTKSWHTDQTSATLLVSYWLTSGDRTMLGVEAGQEELLINCQSDEGSISLTTTAGTTAAQLPKAPGTYVIEAGGLTAERKPGQIQTVINLKDSKLWYVTEPGTFEITSFAPSHLAGSFAFKIGRSETGSQTVAATATISGTFDLGCTGSACS